MTDYNPTTNQKSAKDSSSGSSKFILFPIVSSILDSKSHTVTAVCILIATAILFQFTSTSVTSVTIVFSSMCIYSLSLSAFKFGDRAEYFGEEMDEYPFLIAISGLFIPVTMAMGYILLTDTSSFISATIIGISVFGIWIVNRRLYITMKEDIIEHNYVTSHFWLYISRVPFVGALIATLYVSVPPSVWVSLLGLSTATSFVYGIVRIIEPNPSTEYTSTYTPTHDTPNLDIEADIEDLTTTESESNDSTSEEQDTTTSDRNYEHPKDVLDNYDKAKELTHNLKDAIEALNESLERERLSNYKLPEISGKTIPPEFDKAKEIHKTSNELNEYILKYNEENTELRHHLLEVQQNIQEIDEFIYTDIDAPDYK